MISPELAEILIAVIMMTMVGLAVGNYATSIIYRLPRKLKIANDPPYCDACHTYLEQRDLFPFFSWVFNKGKCRFCGVSITAQHAVVELCSVALFNYVYFKFGLGDQMVVAMVLGMGWIMLSAIACENKYIEYPVYSLILASALIFRTLTDGTIFNSVQAGVILFVAAAIFWKLISFLKKEEIDFPDYIPILALAGFCAGTGNIVYIAIGTLLLAIIFKFIPILKIYPILLASAIVSILIL